jgi:hypothetical protein
VAAERLLAIFNLMVEHGRSDSEAGGLCLVAKEILLLGGASIALTARGQPLTSFCASNETAQSLLDLEITLAEGPGTDAAASAEAVEEKDLAHAATPRWPAYTPSALECGARSVFGFPVRIGLIRLGVVSLFGEQPGELTESQSIDSYLLASVVGRSLLALQAGAPPGSLSETLEREAMFDFSVHQAAGMIAVQGSLTIGDALVALRAHAFALNASLTDLAVNVISRRTRFDGESRTWSEAE